MKTINFTNKHISLYVSLLFLSFFVGAKTLWAQSKTGPITEREVKAYFTDWWTHDCKREDECSVRFDGPVRIAGLVRKTFQIGGTYNSYPVKVDFTTSSLYPNSVYKLTHYTRAVYYFHRNSFGDWEMGKEGERTTEETVNKFAAVEHSRLPAPDFSAMAEWYDVVKYEYPKPGEQKLTIYFKPKSKTRPLFFAMEFRDKNGVLVGSPAPMCCSSGLGDTDTGAVGTQTVYVPAESELGRIASAKIINTAR